MYHNVSICILLSLKMSSRSTSHHAIRASPISSSTSSTRGIALFRSFYFKASDSDSVSTSLSDSESAPEMRLEATRAYSARAMRQ